MPTQEQYRHRKCVGSRANKLSVGCGFVSIIFFISPFSCCSMLNNVQGRNVGLRAEREQDDPISLPFAQFALTTETILDCIERERQNVFYKFIIVDLARYAQFVYGLTAKLSQKLSLNALNLHNSAFTHSMCQTTVHTARELSFQLLWLRTINIKSLFAKPNSTCARFSLHFHFSPIILESKFRSPQNCLFWLWNWFVRFSVFGCRRRQRPSSCSGCQLARIATRCRDTHTGAMSTKLMRENRPSHTITSRLFYSHFRDASRLCCVLKPTLISC